MYIVKEFEGIAYVYDHGERTSKNPTGLNKVVWKGPPAEIPEEYKS